MDEAQTQQRLRAHPDVFTREEAREYLHLDNIATVDWLREQSYLTGHKIGKDVMFHRSDLDACVLKAFGKAQMTQRSTEGKAERRVSMKLARA